MLQYLEPQIIDIPDSIKSIVLSCEAKDGRFISKKFNKIITEEIEKFLLKYNLKSNDLFFICKNGLNYIPICKNCGKQLSNLVRKHIYCSTKCENNNLELLEKRKETCLKKYGVENILQSEEVKEKIKQNNLEKYGVEHYSQTNEFKEKYSKTMLENYGVKHNFQSEECKVKIRNTCLKRYGTSVSSQNQNVKNKMKQTCQLKYGKDYYVQTDSYKEKAKNTNLERYGCENPFQSKEIRKRIVENSNITKKSNNYEHNKEILKHRNILLLNTKDEYINLKKYSYKCLICNTIFISNYTTPQQIICPECSKYSNKSKVEKEVLNFIESIYSGEIVENDRIILKPKELDIYIPEKKIAIEFDGNYWHTEDKVGKYYHQEKTIECRNKGIRLIHIFEWEWNDKQDICKSIIKSALGIYDKTIYARKCVVKKLSLKEYTEFLDINHLQGSANSSIRYGLYNQDELVAVIGFGNSRFKKDETELHRFCCKLDYSIPGAFSKLIKHSNISNFITYVDLAHFTGDGYKKMRFTEICITKPNYKWVKGIKILNRFSTQKHKLKNLLGENYNPNFSEEQNMLDNGYNKVYDSGNIKMVYKGM